MLKTIRGVLFDGEKAFASVLDALKLLKANGKKTCVLSNSPRVSTRLSKLLLSKGLPEDMFTGIMTSGQATVNDLKNNKLKFGTKYFHFGSDAQNDYQEIFLELGHLVKVNKISDADFLINTDLFHLFGLQETDEWQIQVDKVIDEAVRCKIPWVCSNPDKVAFLGQKKIVCPGALVEMIRSKNGDVHMYGKPYQAIYEQVFEILGISDRTRIVAIGDAIETDILGASMSDLDSVLVVNGIHQEQLILENTNNKINIQKIHELAQNCNANPPNYVMLQLQC